MAARSAVPELPDAANPFLSQLLSKAGLDANAYKPTALNRRLYPSLRALRANSIEAAQRTLDQTPDALPRALSSVLIGVSEFFREPAVFDFLSASVIPHLVEGRAGLRVCSIGCSDGQELYSAAILLAEAGILETSYVVGMDCRHDSIANARRGAYSLQEARKQITPERLHRFFDVTGTQAIASSQLRAQLFWNVCDLLRGPIDTAWDLILFRNVAIYLREEHAHLAWSKLTGALRSGGVIVTGRAERPPPELCLTRLGNCIYQRR